MVDRSIAERMLLNPGTDGVRRLRGRLGGVQVLDTRSVTIRFKHMNGTLSNPEPSMGRVEAFLGAIRRSCTVAGRRPHAPRGVSRLGRMPQEPRTYP
jgi:hypothetical protein